MADIHEDNAQALDYESDPSEYSSSESEAEEPNQNLELHDAGEANLIEDADVIDLPTYDEIIAELEEDAAEMMAYGEAQEERVEQLQNENQANMNKANGIMEVLERRWLDEAERSYQLQMQLEASQEEVYLLRANRARIKRAYGASYAKLEKKVIKFPSPAKDLGFEINRSVVLSMIHKIKKKARKI